MNNITPQTTPDEIHAGIAGLVQEVVGIAPGDVPLTASFAGDLGMDSLALQEIAVGIEERFGVAVPDGDVASLVLVQDAVAYIRGALG